MKFSDAIENKKPVLVVNIGLPCSGKSTYTQKHYKNFTIISRDDIIEKFAAQEGMTYSEYFKFLDAEGHKKIDAIFDEKFLKALQSNKNIVIDKTNLSKKSRNILLSRSKLIKNYYKIANVFLVPMNTLLKRNEERKKTGKDISLEVFEKMQKSFIMPDLREFDEINTIYK